MGTLTSELRKNLERVVIEARDAAEVGARAALEALAVHHHEPYPHMKPAQRELRNHLRARARQLGDRQDGSGRLAIGHLAGECAYEHWHRMLFARFLAENNLLIEPDDNMAISLAEAEELAKEEGVDVWIYASRCAQRMLPQIFRPDLPAPRPNSGQFCVYVLKCSDGSFYIGQTDDFPRRLSEHEKGEVSWTAARLPVEPIHWEVFPTKEKAFKREQDLETGFGRQWLKRKYAKGALAAAARQAGDPLLQITFATEHMLKLEKLLASLPAAVFMASDALGWVYQFWQSKKKDEVNRSEVKIGADEISAVTQLFTEPYMVEFLLHNTLGAWHAGKVLPALSAEALAKADEASLRKACSLPGVIWEYLRFVREDKDGKPCEAGDRPAKPGWRPAAGTFDGWPKTAAEIRILDPCCGSGHFLVAALRHLVPIRMVEEGLSAAQAVDAVLRDNLHGLEIDERCCQIAAFALAFAAWTYPKAGGYRPLPELHIACTGIGPQCSADQWIKLAEQSGIPMPAVGREAIKNGLLNLHRLFSQAPTLGSLINPAELPADLIAADYETIQPYLTAIRAVEKADDETRERAIAAAGMVKAADLLAGDYTLVITNVPYLGRGKQDDLLKTHLEKHYNEGKADLATAFVVRCLELCAKCGTVGIVTPQNWLFLTTYTKLRQRLLARREWNAVVRLGENAFESTAAAGAFAAFVVLTASPPSRAHAMAGIDVSAPRGKRPICSPEKAALLGGDMDAAERAAKAANRGGRQPNDADGSTRLLPQADQLTNPDARITLATESAGDYLFLLADTYQGVKTGDNDRLRICHWELAKVREPWRLMQSSPSRPCDFDGCTDLLNWHGDGALMARLQGLEGVGAYGVGIGSVSSLPTCFFLGQHYNSAIIPIIPKKQRDLAAIAAFCFDPSFREAIRQIDQKVAVTTATVLKVPFDVEHWQKIARQKYPDGLPEPESDDPTQWLFHGRPDEAQEGTELQVAVARLLGYRWPAELDDLPAPQSGAARQAGKMRLSKRAGALVKKCGELAKFADNDGIVCIPAVRGEDPAAERLLRLLGACGIQPEGDLDDWLRSGFFEEHCKLFHDRPFVWHIWDGRKRDGFHALVNYHKLAESGGKGRRLLENLTYAYLGEWITCQKDGVKRGEGGAEDRLAAAVELQNRLKAILDGEPPFDIFVRWKPLAEQPIGWEPDINDGVRLNIRPFLASDLPGGRTSAGILRYKPNIKWTKDRGKEPNRPKADFPWFWGWDEKTIDFAGGKTFDGNRHNDCHYTSKTKQIAREAVNKSTDNKRNV